MPQIVDIILRVKKIRATPSLALRSDLWEKYKTIALIYLSNPSTSIVYMLFQKRFILVLFHERFKLASSHHWNFWLRIKLSFQNSDLWAKFLPPPHSAPLKFPMVTWYIFWSHKFGDVVHSLLSGNPCSTNCHMTWLPPERLQRRLHDNIIISFPHFSTDFFLPSYFITTSQR